MVKSYQGARKEQENKIKQLLVKDYMTTQLIRFYPNQSIDEVVNILVYRNISGGPVVDEQNKLIGVISEGDCLKEIVRGKYSNEPSLSGLVKDRMNKEVKTLKPNDSILDAAMAFLDKKVRRFPIIDNGELVGQISQRDVMKAIEST